jgi:hypothetical protein
MRDLLNVPAVALITNLFNVPGRKLNSKTEGYGKQGEGRGERRGEGRGEGR